MKLSKSQRIFIYTLLKSELFCINDDIAMLDLRMMPYPETSITWKAYEDAKKILIQKYNMVEGIIKVFEVEGEPK